MLTFYTTPHNFTKEKKTYHPSNLVLKVRSVKRYVLDGAEPWPADPQPEQADGDQVLDQTQEQGVDAVPQECRQPIR